MQVYFSDRVVLPLPAGHRFPLPKYSRLVERVKSELVGVRLVAAPAAGDGELELAHDRAYIEAVCAGTLAPDAQREIGFPWSQAMVERARRSVGATIAAARAALAEGAAAQLGGGTHHAHAHKGSGYCVFNDVAVAARVLQNENQRSRRQQLRVLVIDLDVHQGDGTAAIFSNDETVFTLSLHGARNFPLRKQAGDLDVDLPDGCGDAQYLSQLDAALSSTWQRQAGSLPGLAFYLAGADVHEGDRLGRLKLTAQGMAERDRRVCDGLRDRGVPMVMLMAGGYGHDIETTVSMHLQSLRIATDCWHAWQMDRARLRTHSGATGQLRGPYR
jgi:acetoin utilization deacetylase AcuC-like enzyme